LIGFINENNNKAREKERSIKTKIENQTKWEGIVGYHWFTVGNRIVVVDGGGLGAVLSGAGVVEGVDRGGSESNTKLPVARVKGHVLAISPERRTATHALIPPTHLLSLRPVVAAARPHTCGAPHHARAGDGLHALLALLPLRARHQCVHRHRVRRRRTPVRV